MHKIKILPQYTLRVCNVKKCTYLSYTLQFFLTKFLGKFYTDILCDFPHDKPTLTENFPGSKFTPKLLVCHVWYNYDSCRMKNNGQFGQNSGFKTLKVNLKHLISIEI